MIIGRVCIRKSDSLLIEFQSGDAALGTLTQNAINAGYSSTDIEEKTATQAEYDSILALQPAPAPVPEPLKLEIAALTTTDLTNITKMKGILEQLRIGKMML